MNSILDAIAPKSDQANFDDFAGGVTKTIKVTGVSIKPGDQPTTISYECDNGKPYKPCKSMARVLVHCWGPDAKAYVGKSMTLYGDPNVIFGGAKVGGIRISHLSDIKEPITMALTTTRANRKPYTVKPLMVENKIDHEFEKIKQAGRDAALNGGKSLDEWLKNLPVKDKTRLAEFGPDIRKIANEVDAKTPAEEPKP